jgi:predicted DCC family thiol-disulfide oxidoreductase YuxK
VNHPVVLFDGECNLCHGGVRFIVANDPAGRFRFASLQSATARALAPAAAGDMGSITLVEEGRIYQRSAAVLRIAAHLRAPWPALARLAALLSPGLLDMVYSAGARSRYRLFGRRAVCDLPQGIARERFV